MMDQDTIPLGNPTQTKNMVSPMREFTKHKEQKADMGGHILLETIWFGQVCSF